MEFNMNTRNINLRTDENLYSGIITDKGTQLMERMLLMQYSNSTNLKEYIGAFVSEMDYLFQQIEEVYQGRFIKNAVGRQLDIIGIILDEERGINLPRQFFGFSDSNNGSPIPFPNTAKMADKSSPTDGGIFRSSEQSFTNNYVLSDTEFRRLLYAKATLLTRDECSRDNAYYIMSLLLGRFPRIMQIEEPAPRRLLINFSTEDVSMADVALISYFGKYLIPLGTSLTIQRV